MLGFDFLSNINREFETYLRGRWESLWEYDLEIKITNTKDKHYHDFNLKVYTENFISNVN